MNKKTSNANERLHNQRLMSLGVLAGGVAHDFNNILTGMMGHIAFIKRIVDKDEKKNSALLESVLSIEDAITKASGLTKQILNFSRLKLNDEKKVLDLEKVFKDTIILLRASIPPIFEIETKLEKNIYVEAVEASISQILINLVVNARDALKLCKDKQDKDNQSKGTQGKNKDTLKIKIVLEKTEDNFCKFSVTDNGIGMSKEVKEKILLPYFTTKGDKGTGLGLYTVCEIIKSLEGKLSIVSKEGVGTSFRIKLPLAKTKVEENAKDDKTQVKKQVKKSAKILFVDDEEVIRDVFFEGLKFLGYDVVAASGTKEAYDAFKKERGKFDLVITDMLMPDGSGEDLYIDLMSIRPDVKVIVISGFSAKEAVDKMLAYGAKAFLAKPFSIEELDSKIQEVL